MRQEDEADGPQDTGKAQEPEGSAEKAGSKKDKYQKAQAKAEHAGEKLGKAREKLDKTEAKRAAKKPPGLAKKAVRGARTEAWFYLHNKIHEVEHENVGVEGAHKSELVAEAGARKLTRYAKRRYREHPARKVAKWERKDIKARANVDFQKMASDHPELASNPLSRVQQKWKLKRRYSKEAKAAAKQGAKAAKKTAAASGTATRRAAQFVTRHPVAVLVLLLLLLLCFLVSAVSSIFPTLGSGLANALSGTSYASEDTDLLGVDEDYTVTKKNPDVYPTFTAQYTDEDVPNNSLIVECGEKSRYISYNDIYLTDVDYTTYSYVYSFDGEGAITSAIDYVISDELPKLYLLDRHGEAKLPSEFQTQIEKENMNLESFSLLNTDEIPEDADALLIYAPESDISDEEATLLEDYLEAGGKLLVIAGPTENGTLTNLYSVLESYGVEAADGLVVDTDREHYAFQQPYILLPDISSSEITDPLLEENYYAIIPIAQGLTITGSSATALLTTSYDSFSKIAGFQLDTYEKEEDDIDGPFAVAVSVDTGSDGQLIWFSSNYFLEESYNAYSSGANLDLAMNALSALMGEREAVSIRSKSLSYNYLTISESAAAMLKTWMIGVIPAAFVLYGVFTVIDRRKKRHA